MTCDSQLSGHAPLQRTQLEVHHDSQILRNVAGPRVLDLVMEDLPCREPGDECAYQILQDRMDDPGQ